MGAHPRRGGRAAGLGTFAALAALSLLASSADEQQDAQDFWAAPRGAPQFDSAQDLSDGIADLKRRSWVIYQAHQNADVRGLTSEDDGRQWVLGEAEATKLDGLLAAAQKEEAARHAPQLRKALAEAARMVETQRYRCFVIVRYWSYQTMLDEHAAKIESLKERLPGEETTAPEAAVQRAREEYAAAYREALATPGADIARQDAAAAQLQVIVDKTFKAYNRERGNLAAALGTHQSGQPLQFQKRSEPCPPPATETSGRALPTIARDNDSSEHFYPPLMKQQLFEGDTIIDAHVSATGCVEEAAVYVGSGVAELDAAGLAWTLQAHMLPAQMDGRATPATLRFRFRLVMTK